MLERHIKEQKFQIFNFFKAPSKQRQSFVSKFGQSILNIFKFISFFLGTLFFIGLFSALTTAAFSDSYVPPTPQSIELKKDLGFKTLNEANFELIELIKSQKEPTVDSLMAALNAKYGSSVYYNVATEEFLEFTTSADDIDDAQYLITLKGNKANLRILNSSAETLKLFEQDKRNKKVSWTIKPNKILSITDVKDTLSIDIK